MRRRPAQPSIRTERDVALRMLGFTRDQVELHHSPALGLREWNEEAGDHIPAAADPGFLVFIAKAEHRVKTFGSGATTRGSDIGDIAHLKRLEKKWADFRRDLLSPTPAKPSREGRWPKRKIWR